MRRPRLAACRQLVGVFMRSGILLLGILAALACSEGATTYNRQLYLDAFPDSTGVARVMIPAGVIRPAIEYLPAVSCYIAAPADYRGWLVIADGYDFFAPFCFVQLDNAGQWWLTTLNIPPNWLAVWVVTY